MLAISSIEESTITTTTKRRKVSCRKFTSEAAREKAENSGKAYVIRVCPFYFGSNDPAINFTIVSSKLNGIWRCPGICFGGGDLTRHSRAKSSANISANEYINCTSLHCFHSKKKIMLQLKDDEAREFENEWNNIAAENTDDRNIIELRKTLCKNKFPNMHEMSYLLINKQQIINTAKAKEAILKETELVVSAKAKQKRLDLDIIGLFLQNDDIITNDASDNSINDHDNLKPLEPSQNIEITDLSTLSQGVTSSQDLSRITYLEKQTKYVSLLTDFTDTKIGVNMNLKLTIKMNDYLIIELIPLNIQPNHITLDTLEKSISYAINKIVRIDILTTYKQFSNNNERMLKLFKNPSVFEIDTLCNLQLFMMQYYETVILMLTMNNGHYEQIWYQGEFRLLSELNSIVAMVLRDKYVILSYDTETHYFSPVLLKEDVLAI
jgi:hypothetical protein